MAHNWDSQITDKNSFSISSILTFTNWRSSYYDARWIWHFRIVCRVRSDTLLNLVEKTGNLGMLRFLIILEKKRISSIVCNSLSFGPFQWQKFYYFPDYFILCYVILIYNQWQYFAKIKKIKQNLTRTENFSYAVS